MLAVVFLTLLFAITVMAIIGFSVYLLWWIANLLNSYDVEIR
jgi:hypothetical protein